MLRRPCSAGIYGGARSPLSSAASAGGRGMTAAPGTPRGSGRDYPVHEAEFAARSPVVSPPILTCDGLMVREIEPAYLSNGPKADDPFTYHRPLSGLRGQYQPGSQYWQHPPDFPHTEFGISEQTASYPRKHRPRSAYSSGAVVHRYAGSGYGDNNATVIRPEWAEKEHADRWVSTYTDLQGTGHLMPRLEPGGATRPRPGTARLSISASGAPTSRRPMAAPNFDGSSARRPQASHFGRAPAAGAGAAAEGPTAMLPLGG
eukprot:CAMPEP_0204178418 /NCGR_PEP_ID=MMETSP0361-20130328/49302_1 /ASSEMBLY_ACC=CAM_ASM_000343 /TAXON_ID=268821 /ORGANISM="Scrippsiella Hangoei, Strain SHTV-5" /LENGTH=259 /DNA_ID=CAMNT_0051137525 /DNA_START=35 /DNA_END=812 /DNA_ORIENTATION=+